MALVACPDCSSQISDHAAACSDCGRPHVAAHRPRLAGLLGNVLLGAALALLTSCQPQAPGQSPVVDAPAPPKPVPTQTPNIPVTQAQSAEPYTPQMQGLALITSLLSERRKLASEMWNAASRIDDEEFVGTAFNEIDVQEHSCFILGNLLDRGDLVRHLAVQYKPDYVTATADNAQDLRIQHLSASNFVVSAERLIHLTRDEWVLEWNLDCRAKLGIPADSGIAQTGQATFYSIQDDGKLLQVLGDIEPGFSQRLIDAVEANPNVEIVALGSRGGVIYEALRAGAYIRGRGLDTTLWDGCYSACPLVFMAGNQRQVWSPYPVLGFHQASSQGTAVALDSQVYRDIYRYLVLMGVDARFVLNRMWSADPGHMTEIQGSDETLCMANVATWVQRGCVGPSYRQAN